MTSLTTEAASFFSRRFRVKGQPSPKDVACGVFVGLCGVSACFAGKRRLVEPVLLGCVPAGFAAVGCVPRVDFDPDASSVFRFGAQNRDEVAPARVRDTSVETGLGRCPVGQEATRASRIRCGSGPTQHIGDRQVFHCDQFVPSNELSRDFVVKVATGVGNLTVSGGHRFASANTVVGAALSTAEPVLCSRQLFGPVASQARIFNVFTVGGSGEGDDTHIYAGTPSRGRQRISGYLVTGQDQHPPTALSADLDRLHPPPHLAVRGNLHLPDALQIHAVGVRVPTGTVTIFGPLDTVKSALALKSWIPWLCAASHPSEKPRETSVKPSQHGLFARKRPRRHVRTHATDLTQLGRLIAIPNHSFVVRPRISTLLQRSVVELSMSFHAGRQRNVLARCGTHPKLISRPHGRTSHRYLKHGIKRPSIRTDSIDPWSVEMAATEQQLHRGSAISGPYEAPPTGFTFDGKGALWMYV